MSRSMASPPKTGSRCDLDGCPLVSSRPAWPSGSVSTSPRRAPRDLLAPSMRCGTGGDGAARPRLEAGGDGTPGVPLSESDEPLWPGIPRHGGSVASRGAGVARRESSHRTTAASSATSSLGEGLAAHWPRPPPASWMLGAGSRRAWMGELLDGLAGQTGVAVTSPSGRPGLGSLLDGCPLVSPRLSWPSGSVSTSPRRAPRDLLTLSMRCGAGGDGAARPRLGAGGDGTSGRPALR